MITISERMLLAMAKLRLQCDCGNAVEWRFLLSGVTLGAVADMPNPAPRWLTDKSWTQVIHLSELPAFQVRQHAVSVLPARDRYYLPGTCVCLLRTDLSSSFL